MRRPPVPWVASLIPPGPSIAYCSFDCNEPAECHLLFANITSELQDTLLYHTETYNSLPYYMIRYSTKLHDIALYRTARYGTLPNWKIQYSTMLQDKVPHVTVFY